MALHFSFPSKYGSCTQILTESLPCFNTYSKKNFFFYSSWLVFPISSYEGLYRQCYLRLGANSSDQDTRQSNIKTLLICMYGTHFVYSMRMGGRYGYQSEITNSNSMELTIQGLNVKAISSQFSSPCVVCGYTHYKHKHTL